MRVLALYAALSLAAAVVPAVAQAAGTVTIAQAPAGAPAMSPDQMKAAVKSSLQSVNLTPRQKLEIKPMIQNYETQTANATPDQKKAAGKTLLENIYGVLTPAQQTQFKASMKSSMMQAH